MDSKDLKDLAAHAEEMFISAQRKSNRERTPEGLYYAGMAAAFEYMATKANPERLGKHAHLILDNPWDLPWGDD